MLLLPSFLLVGLSPAARLRLLLMLIISMLVSLLYLRLLMALLGLLGMPEGMLPQSVYLSLLALKAMLMLGSLTLKLIKGWLEVKQKFAMYLLLGLQPKLLCPLMSWACSV
jgi:hypothetical protein